MILPTDGFESLSPSQTSLALPASFVWVGSRCSPTYHSGELPACAKSVSPKADQFLRTGLPLSSGATAYSPPPPIEFRRMPAAITVARNMPLRS
jgi:hypothetical protein